MTALNRQVAERMGYQVVEIHKLTGVPIELSPEYHLIDPDGRAVGGWFTSPEACGKHIPAFDTWAGVGLVLEWLGKKRGIYFEIVHLDDVDDDTAWSIRDHTDRGYGTTVDAKGVNDLPRMLCEFALEVTKEAPSCPQT